MAQFGKTFLEAYGIGAGVRIAGRNWTTDAGISAFKSDFADAKPNHTANLRPEKLESCQESDYTPTERVGVAAREEALVSVLTRSKSCTALPALNFFGSSCFHQQISRRDRA